MEYVYAAMLLHKAGKKIDENSVKKVLEAAGVTVDEGRVRALVAALEGVNIDEAIKNATIMAAPVASAPSAHTESKTEAKKEEKKEDKQAEEQSAAGLSALFG
ncbi:MAG: 50S ribosomal protein P1 [Candidatus Woesearchaeota archaeon]|nr:MAG: 50S ribosomal protein P1 [Candidatus Woesearchaeota archaeon]